METLQIDKSNALQAFKEADSTGKALLTNLFGKKIFLEKITDRIKTFEDACAEVGEDPDDDNFSEGTDDEIAFKKIKVVIRALNEGWKPNWDNSGQYKWYPWFYMNKPGFRFDGTLCGISSTLAPGGSRLCFETEELAKYAGQQFLDLYKDFISESIF
jgi:hypothetical protein